MLTLFATFVFSGTSFFWCCKLLFFVSAFIELCTQQLHSGSKCSNLSFGLNEKCTTWKECAAANPDSLTLPANVLMFKQSSLLKAAATCLRVLHQSTAIVWSCFPKVQHFCNTGHGMEKYFAPDTILFPLSHLWFNNCLPHALMNSHIFTDVHSLFNPSKCA